MFKINTSIQNHLRELLQNASMPTWPSILVPFPSSLLNKQDKQTNKKLVEGEAGDCLRALSM